MNNRFSKNGDGKNCAPNDRTSATLGGQQPSHPDNEREQQIIKALTERYDEIEALWKGAEEDLKRFRIPHPVEHCYASDYEHGYPIHYALWWARYGKGWRICHEQRTAFSEVDPSQLDECDCKPVIECSLDIRLRMIPE